MQFPSSSKSYVLALTPLAKASTQLHPDSDHTVPHSPARLLPYRHNAYAEISEVGEGAAIRHTTEEITPSHFPSETYRRGFDNNVYACTLAILTEFMQALCPAFATSARSPSPEQLTQWNGSQENFAASTQRK